MIDRKTAKKFIARLLHLPFAPDTPEGQAELMTALAESSSSEQIAERVVTEFSQHSDRCPQPVDIRRECHLRYDETQRRRRDCEFCGGVGFVTVYSLQTAEQGYVRKEPLTLEQFHYLAKQCPLSKSQTIYEGADPCPHCRPEIRELWGLPKAV